MRGLRLPRSHRHLRHPLNKHLTRPATGVWRSHLISRAAENQRFVLACNAAEPLQHCPSKIVSSRGEVLAESVSTDFEILRAVVDIDQVGGRYLGQRRDVSSL